MLRLSDTLEWIKADLEAGLLTVEEAIEKAYDTGFSEALVERDNELEDAYDEGYADGLRGY